MKKKSDKVLILLIIIVGMVLVSWILPQGEFSLGVFENVDKVRVGIFDIFVNICMALYYNYADILFILIVGGCYGVLSKSVRYRKLVDKTANLIKGKEHIALIVTTFVISLFTSISNQLFSMLVFVPFIVTVFLRNGKDRLTALAASFGGILVGFVGATFSTYAYEYIKTATALEANSLIGLKFIIYFIALILFDLFAILHMKKYKKVDDKKYDLFATEVLEEPKGKKSKKVKLWPILVVSAVLFVLIVLGQINWEESFGVEVFTNGFNKFQNSFKIGDVPFFSALLGEQFAAFGKWDNSVVLSFLAFVSTIIIAISEKMDFKDFVLRFDVGIKKMLRLAIIFGLVQTIYVMSITYQWIPSIVTKLFGTGEPNILNILVVSILVSFFTINPGYGNYTYGYFLSTVMGEKLADSIVIWHFGTAMVMILAPTSMLVLLALTYLDIPYKKWLKYIWKFALSFFGLVLIVLLVKLVM